MSSLFDYATFLLMLFFFGCARFTAPGTSADMKGYCEALFHTGWFVESILTQTLIVHVMRTRRVPCSPAAGFLGFVPLPAICWAWIGGFLVLYCTLTHLVKSWFFRKFGVD